ncbi:uncharacterized protein [Pagrus major]|uniref:uncharacterized protein n=1 Tax=Pagrus major TaxID=143350 RepID=UPI003CC84551
MPETSSSSTQTVLILFFCLLGLVILLIFLYKKLNKEANGEYTIRRIVYKEGGVRDQVRGAALAVGTRLGVQLWPRSDTDEEGEEMQDIEDEEAQVEDRGSQGSGSQGSDSEGDDQEDSEGGNLEQGEGGDTSDDKSSLEGSEAGEQARLVDQTEKGEENEEKDGEGKGEASGGAGLLIDLNQFSGSAIWSEEERGVSKESDVTAL